MEFHLMTSRHLKNVIFLGVLIFASGLSGQAVPVYAPINTNAYLSWTIPAQSSTIALNIYPPGSSDSMMIVRGTTGIPFGSYSGRVNFTGDLVSGSVSFWLYQVALSDGGVYTIKRSPTNPPIGNQKLYVTAVPVYAPINTNAYISWTIAPQASTIGSNIYPPGSSVSMMIVRGTTGIPLGSYSGRVNFTGDLVKGSASFWLYQVVLSDGGVYTMKPFPSSPPIGSQTLYVTVNPDQAVISEMAGDDAVVGSAHTLTCSATSTTVPPGLPMSYRWYANEIHITAPHNEYVLEGTRNSQLRIKVVKKSDKNTAFTCSGYEVESLMSDQSAVKTIDPKYPPELYLQPDGQQNVVQNGEITMICTITDANPAVSSIKWRKDGSMVANTVTVYTIASVKKTHAGRYSCEAENDIGTGTSNNTLILNVQWSPVVILLPGYKPYYVLTKSDIILSCGWDANPDVSSYIWLFNDGHTAVVQQNYTLHNVAKANDGTYRCQAGNGILQPGSGEKSIIIHYGPEITLIDRKEVIEHRKLEVPCVVDANPVARVEWTGPRIRQSSTNLVMDDISRSRTGTYTCTATNTVTPSGLSIHELTKAKEVYVDVLYPPDVLVIYTNATEDDKMATIACLPNGNPKSYSFEAWKQRWRTGEEIRVFQDARQASLTLPRGGDSLGYMDSGIYTVTVSNDIPDQNNQKLQSVDVSFVVLSRPVILDHDDLKTGTDLDMTVTINVTFYCNTGTLTVAWLRESTNASIATGTNNTTIAMSKTRVHLPVYDKTINADGYLAKLTIENIQESHLGKYKAVITNDVGSKYVIREIVAAGKPHTPTDFKTTASSTSSVKLTWRPGYHGGGDQTFVLQYKTDSSSWNGNISVPGYKLQDVMFNTTVTQLIPNTLYTFRIYAVNIYGRSDYADSIPEETTRSICTPVDAMEACPIVAASAGSFIGGIVFTVIVLIITVLLRRTICPNDFKCLEKKTDTYQDLKPPQRRTVEEAGPYDQLELYSNDNRVVSVDKSAYSTLTYENIVSDPPNETLGIDSTSQNNETIKHNEDANPYINTTINQG